MQIIVLLGTVLVAQALGLALSLLFLHSLLAVLSHTRSRRRGA